MNDAIMKYIPTKLKNHVTSCYKEGGSYVVEFNEHVYDSIMESAENAQGYATIFADSVSELRSMLAMCEVI